MNEKVAKSSLYPSLGLGGSLGTAWTNQGQRIANITQIPDVEVTDVTIDGNPAVLEVPTVMVDAELENTPYVDQLDNNLGYGFGFSLNVPIYNNYTRKNNLAQARISKEQTELDNLSLKQTIRNNVLRAMADAKGAQKRYVAAEKSLEASRISYENAQRRLELGGGNNFDFLVAGDNYRIAENNFLQAKYDFVFKLKVLDYWLGNPIVF
jgi:outer membrane protein